MRSIGIMELLVVFLAVCGALVVPGILFLITLQRALQQCSPQSRTISPGQVWLMLIPLFNLVWQFLLVGHIANSLRNEFAVRRIPSPEVEPGKGIGLAMCILGTASIIPVLGFATAIAGFVCWIIYWVKISEYSGKLALPPIPGGSPGVRSLATLTRPPTARREDSAG